MKINRNNYEPFFIDYLDGNLDEKEVDDFLEFIQDNPDLKTELELAKPVQIEPETKIFNGKEKLFKELYDLEPEFNRAAVERLEGDLSENEKEAFDAYLLSHPEKQKDFAQFNKTKLQADKSIFFNKKHKLFHKSFGKTVLLWSMRAAAILVLALSFYLFFERSSSEIVPQDNIARNDAGNIRKTELPQEDELPAKHEIQMKEKTSLKTPISIEVTDENITIPNKENLKISNKDFDVEVLAVRRTPVETLPQMEKLTPSFDVQLPAVLLATMYITIPEIPKYNNDERLLAQRLIEKTGINKLSLNKMTKVGLNLVSTFSKDNFSYETNDEGKVTEYNFDSRLLAFSIPANREDAE